MKPEVHYCKFCNMVATLQCDGILPNWLTCDNWMCRRCAKVQALVCEFDKKTGRRKGNTRDLCPDCVKAGRSAFEKDLHEQSKRTETP